MEGSRVSVNPACKLASGDSEKSNLTQYGITIASATIESVDYDPLIDKKLEAKIDASTRESISKQLAITAEQEAVTAKMEGEKLIKSRISLL